MLTSGSIHFHLHSERKTEVSVWRAPTLPDVGIVTLNNELNLFATHRQLEQIRDAIAGYLERHHKTTVGNISEPIPSEEAFGVGGSITVEKSKS